MQESPQQKFQRLTQFERAARKEGKVQIAGVDEAGRGPLAGPVVAAAVILPEDFFLPKINDSKALSQKLREELYYALTQDSSVVYAVGVIDPGVIDEINILQATLRAMVMAIEALLIRPDLVLVDGDKAPPVSIPTQTIVKGDQNSQSIMAAANIAKVTRDKKMEEYHNLWPQYGFLENKGYPTKEHREALKKWGPSPIHRKTFAPVRLCG